MERPGEGPVVGPAGPPPCVGEGGCSSKGRTASHGGVPVWVNGLQRWVTGVDRRTTCDDVIKALLLGNQPHQAARGATVGGTWTAEHQQQNHHLLTAVPEDMHHKYAIVERWRKVERPLDGRSRILKVWSAWGDAQGDVKLALRRRVPGSETSSPGGGSPLSAFTKEAARRRRNPHHRHRLVGSAKTIHPRRLYTRVCREESGVEGEEDAEEIVVLPEKCEWARRVQRPSGGGATGEPPKFTETMEKLMKLILAQGETIQAQLKKLREREEQIDHLEHEVHRLRVKKDGSNYLLDTYLKGVDADIGVDEEEEEEGGGERQGQAEESGHRGGEDSGVVTEGGSTGDGSAGDSVPPCDAAVKLEGERRLPGPGGPRGHDGGALEGSEVPLESLEDLQLRIELWEKIMKVNRKLERTEECLVKLHAKLRREYEASDAAVEREAENRELEWMMAEVQRAAMQMESGERELQRNEQALARATEWLRVRRKVLEGLQLELEAVEKESEALSREASVRIPCGLDGATQGEVQGSKGPGLEGRPEELGPVTTTARKIGPSEKEHVQDTDSNSDTGLSSLHSSGEEGAYVLDTLV